MSQIVPKEPRGPISSRATRLISDFDGTLTKKDTMHVVAEAGYARQRKLQRDSQPRPWAEIVNAYLSDSKAHTDAYLPKEANRTTVAQEMAWLNSMRPIENASIERAIQAGIFDQMSVADMTEAADKALDSGDIQFKVGWAEIFSAIEQHNATLPEKCRPDHAIQVISVNWSACFVRQILHGCIRRAPDVEDQTKSRWLKDLPVWANELPSLLGANGQSERPSKSDSMRNQRGGIRTSEDKVGVLNSIRDRTKPSVNEIFIYVGDSTTDLECLLAADVGICIRDEPIGNGQKELAATCKRLGIELLHVLDIRDSASASARRIFWARDFGEIREWFEEHHELLKHWQLPTG